MQPNYLAGRLAYFVVHKAINEVIDELVTYLKESDPSAPEPHGTLLASTSKHGAMLTGKQLIYLRRKADPKLLSGALKYRPVKVESAPLSCPHCHAMMRATRFQNSDVYVDVCTKCRFRWLDYHEVTMIAGVERVLLQ